MSPAYDGRAAAALLLALTPPGAVDRPADSPCITWQHQESCFCGEATPAGWTGNNASLYVPSVYTAWRWFPNGTASTGRDSYCAACTTPPAEHEFHCAWELPCYVSGQGWGHHHLGSSKNFCVKNGCNVHLPSGQEGGSCPSTCDDPGDDGPPCTNASKKLGMWLPAKGPKWQNFGWQIAQKGDRPSTAIGQLIMDASGEFVLARAAAAIPFPNCGKGTTGWVKLAGDGSLGCLEYTANVVTVSLSLARRRFAQHSCLSCMTQPIGVLLQMEMCNGFEVAYCTACAPCPGAFNSSFHPGPGCPTCTKPPPAPPAPPPAPPPPPPTGTPCLRFGNAIASGNAIDATISQGSVSHTWHGYRFSQFSDWVSVFVGGTGTITLTDNSTGSALLTAKIPLTPGPLVVVVKGDWPPTTAKHVETSECACPRWHQTLPATSDFCAR